MLKETPPTGMGDPMPADPRISVVDVAARLREPPETPNRRRPGGRGRTAAER